jgi:hypothetical protein
MGYNLELYKHLRASRKEKREIEKALWNTVSRYVDRNTGEIIEKRQLENGEYIKLRKTTNYKNNGRYNSKTITTECEESKQGRIWR